MKEDLVSKKIRMKICLDIIGSVVEYTSDCEVAKSLIMSCRSVRRFMQCQRPRCCRNVVWEVFSRPKRRKMKSLMKHVYRVKISYRIRDYRFFNKFENLAYLYLKNKDFDKCKVLAQVKNVDFIRKLRIQGEKISEKHFRKLEMLKKLVLIDSPYFKTKFFRYLFNLQHLEIFGCQHINQEGLYHLKKLKRLVLVENDSFDDNIFKYLYNLKSLKVRGCQNLFLDKDNMKGLNLDDVVVIMNDNITDELLFGKFTKRIFAHKCKKVVALKQLNGCLGRKIKDDSDIWDICY